MARRSCTECSQRMCVERVESSSRKGAERRMESGGGKEERGKGKIKKKEKRSVHVPFFTLHHLITCTLRMQSHSTCTSCVCVATCVVRLVFAVAAVPRDSTRCRVVRREQCYSTQHRSASVSTHTCTRVRHTHTIHVTQHACCSDTRERERHCTRLPSLLCTTSPQSSATLHTVISCR